MTAPGEAAGSAPVPPAERPFRNPLDPRNPLAPIYLATTLFEISESALRFLVPLNLDARGLGPAQIGLVIAAFSVTSLLSRGFVGGVYRPSRARRMIVLAGLASSLAYLLTPFATGVLPFTAIMAVDGFGWGVASTALLAVMMAATPASMSPAVAMGWFIGFQSIANAVAWTLGGVLGDVLGVQEAMLVLAVVPVVAASLIGIRLPARALEDPIPVVATDEGEVLGDAGRSRRALLRARLGGAAATIGALPAAVWTATLVAVYVNVMNGLMASFFPLLALGLGLSVAQIGTLNTMRSVAAATVRFGSGLLFERVSPRLLNVPLLLLSAGVLVAVPSVPWYAVLLVLFAGSGVARGLLRVTTAAAAMESMRGRDAGMSAAFMTAGLDVGKLLGPLIGGFVAAAVGLDWMFRVVPLGFLAAYAAIVVLLGRRGRGAAGEPGSAPA